MSDGRAYRVRRTEGGRPGASEYGDDLFLIALAAFALAEQGIPHIVEYRAGAGYRAWPPAPVVTCEDAAAAGLAVDLTGKGTVYRLKPGAIAFLNPRPDPGNPVH